MYTKAAKIIAGMGLALGSLGIGLRVLSLFVEIEPRINMNFDTPILILVVSVIVGVLAEISEKVDARI